MEVRVRTADEFRDAHVVIEVNGARLYTAAQVGDAQASEAELVAAPLRRRIEELEARLARVTEQRERAVRAWVSKIPAAESERADWLDERNAELTAELAEQRQRADANQAWAERAEGRVSAYGLDLSATRRKLTEALRAIEFKAAALGRISGAVHGRDIGQILVSDWTSWSEREAAALTGAIRQVRDALGSHSPPGSPKPVTSQA